MDVTVLVSKVVDPGPPAVLRQRAVCVPVPPEVPRSEIASAVRSSTRGPGTSVDVLL